MEELQLQLEALRLDLERERSKRLALEDECDLLAVANQDLQAEVLQLKSTMPTNTVFNQPERAVATVFIEGDGDYVKSAALTVSSACGGMNVLSVCFCRYSTNNNSTHEEIIVCGGGDKRVYGYSQTTQAQIFCVELSAPVLSLDACGSFLAASTMDGSHSYWNANDPSTIHSAKDHSKYVVCIRWSCGGKLLATASYDKTSRIYAVNYPDAVLLRTVSFIDTPESIVFTMNEEGDDELIIGLRDTAYLVYLPCATFIETRVSLNVNDWDTHCSFTPLHLALSPDKSLLLVASDKHMHFVYQVRTNKRLATLAGHSCSDYGKPRVAWHPSGKYVYSNSEHDNRLHIYSLASQRIVHSLAGHSGLIKDLAANSSSGVVATASYDKTLILWR